MILHPLTDTLMLLCCILATLLKSCLRMFKKTKPLIWLLFQTDRRCQTCTCTFWHCFFVQIVQIHLTRDSWSTRTKSTVHPWWIANHRDTMELHGSIWSRPGIVGLEEANWSKQEGVVTWSATPEDNAQWKSHVLGVLLHRWMSIWTCHVGKDVLEDDPMDWLEKKEPPGSKLNSTGVEHPKLFRFITLTNHPAFSFRFS